MSGEFREIFGGHLWSVLQGITERGAHPISQALADLYEALGAVEEGCAWYEASDSGADAPVMALVENWERINTAYQNLLRLRTEYRDIIDAVLRAQTTELGRNAMSAHPCNCGSETITHSHECAIFRCSVCGRPAIVSAPGNEPTYCPLHCPDHDYRHERGEGKRCVTCHAEPPVDWGSDD